MSTGWVHTGRAAIHFGLDAIDRVADVVKAGGRKVMVVTTEGRLRSSRGRLVKRLGRAVTSVFDGVRSHVPTTAVQAAVLQARRRRRRQHRVVRRRIVRRPRQGGVLLHRAAGPVRRARPTLTGRCCRTSRSRPPTPAPSSRRFFGMTDGTRSGRPVVADRPRRRSPRSTTLISPSYAGPRFRRDRHERLAHGVEAAYSPHRTPEARGHRAGRACAHHGHRPAAGGRRAGRPAEARIAHAGAVLRRPVPSERRHGRAPRAGPAARRPHRHPHGLANAVILAHAVRFNADAVPDDVARIGAALGGASDAAAAIDGLRAAIGLPGRLSEVGVDERTSPR